jgi:hypothetical protein
MEGSTDSPIPVVEQAVGGSDSEHCKASSSPNL